MVFVAYAFLLTTRLHFTYSMMVMMVEPLVAGPADREPCPDAEVQVSQNSTVGVAKRLNWTPRQQAAAMGAYFIGTLVSAFPVGVYSSMGHERSILLWCVAVTAVTAALVPVAAIQYDSWITVTFLRFLQG
uniref:Major facilitator superfamily (MFS) profile domain-containing protein n=1 Tax=Sipha flava TaxID=143950 RepID=A0A2S2QYI8_9HEMI